MSFRTISLESRGEYNLTIDMDTLVLSVSIKYNHYISVWAMSLSDTDNNSILAGIVLKPNVDLLTAHPTIKELLGSLAIVEKETDDYKDSTKLGTNMILLWFPPGEDFVLPT